MTEDKTKEKEAEKPCEFRQLCEECHPEKDMQERRKSCDGVRKRRCAVYWAFNDGYNGFDDY